MKNLALTKMIAKLKSLSNDSLYIEN